MASPFDIETQRTCSRCGHVDSVSARVQAFSEAGAKRAVGRLARRTRCSKCGRRSLVTYLVGMAPAALTASGAMLGLASHPVILFFFALISVPSIVLGLSYISRADERVFLSPGPQPPAQLGPYRGT